MKISLLYEDAIVITDYSGEYCFSMDLCSDFPDVFHKDICCTNHHVADELREENVFDPSEGVDDPEAACYWAYFKTEKAARKFIDRLNVFLEERVKQLSLF